MTGRDITTPFCEASIVIDFDSLTCLLPAGHDGMHEDQGDGGRIRWEAA